MNNFQNSPYKENQFRKEKVVSYTESNQLKNYYPVDICTTQQQIIWRDFQDIPFSSAFFSDTLINQPPNERRICYTPFSSLYSLFPEHSEQSKPVDHIEPNGFIFHVSRCGSTLMSQMLAALDSCIVTSEPPIIDTVFRFLHVNPTFTGKEKLFQSVVSALAHKRFVEEKHFFLKFDSWHVAWIPFIKKIYPNTPILFLYREPAEVLASHQKQRGSQMIPHFIDLSALTINTDEIEVYDLDGYCLRMQHCLHQNILKQLSTTPITLVNYSQLPDILWKDLFKKLSMQLEEPEIQKMITRSSFHSKNPQQAFTRDLPPQITHKEYPATRESYHQLEHLRHLEHLKITS